MDEPPLWCRQPYRPLFALGLLLAWVGVGHWLLVGLGWLSNPHPGAHALTQIQGFLSAFAAGFLLTMIPRRTGTAPPAPRTVALCLALPALATAALWLDQQAVAELAWLGFAGVLGAFAIARFLSPGAARRPPNAFVWIPLSLAGALAAATVLAVLAPSGLQDSPLYRTAWLFLTQGLFLGLVFGVGSMLLPLVTRKESSRDAGTGPGDRRERLAHALAFLLLAGSFVLEAERSGTLPYALRAALCAAVLAFGPRLYRRPTVPGLHRRLIWLAGLLLPLGYALAAAFPESRQAGLHLVFIGGLAMMTLGVGMHVTLAHGGAEELVFRSPWPVWAFGGGMLLAALLRGLAEAWPARYSSLLAAAAGSFLIASLAWAAHVLPRLLVAYRNTGTISRTAR